MTKHNIIIMDEWLKTCSHLYLVTWQVTWQSSSTNHTGQHLVMDETWGHIGLTM
jgi:hypothetical protein